MPTVRLPPHVHRVKARGKFYYYYHPQRRSGGTKAVRLPDDPTSREFWNRYHELAELPPEPDDTGKFARVIEAYRCSPQFTTLADATRHAYARDLKFIAGAWGDLPVATLQRKHVLAMRDKGADTPAQTNQRLNTLKVLIDFAIEREFAATNPARDVKRYKRGKGWDAWSAPALEKIATMPWPVAFVCWLAYYTGQRQGDVLRMRRNVVRDGVIALTQQKTGKSLVIPIHRDLAPLLERIDHNAITLAASFNGRPWKASNFRVAFAKWKPSGVQFHGLRKNAVCALLEAGCTTQQAGAITGQSDAVVAYYARQVDQARLAAQAMKLWERV